MKATGIVRRIDDLGRVVIPKEIRRTLRIREGDPLEIYTDNGGEVIFKKYSPMGEMSAFATTYAEVLGKTSGLPVVITDADAAIAAAGISKKEVLDRRITEWTENLCKERRVYARTASDAEEVLPIEGIARAACVAAPIISAGDVVGCVLMLCSDEQDVAGEAESKLVIAAASFLGKQIEG